MKVTITRDESTAQGTFGTLSMPGFSCVTGELPDYDNHPQTSCIPKGTYRCTWTTTHHVGPCYEVLDVPDRTAVLIHAGNWCGDTAMGYRSDVLGCILLGRSVGTLAGQSAVVSSKCTVDRFNNLMSMQDFDLEIT